MEGVLRTRVGYAGGTTPDPTYERLGDHSETVEVEYDPARVSYEELLDVFWAGHRPTSVPFSTQYRAAVFYRDEEERRLAEQSKGCVEEAFGRPVTTEIIPAGAFHEAEAYHQKHRLRGNRTLSRELASLYPDDADLVRSTAAARVNGWLDGYGTLEDVVHGAPRFGLGPRARAELERVVRARERRRTAGLAL